MKINSISTTFDNSTKEYVFYNVPIHSKILDVFIDGYKQLYLTYSTDGLDYNQKKEVFVLVIQPYAPKEFITDNYKFLRSCDVINMNINNTTMGNTITINQEVIKTTYLIFIDENRQTAEIREDNLNQIL